MNSSPEIETSQDLSAGQMLRQARLKAGVHLAVLSVHLKVPVRQLEALEADEWDSDKGPVFYRGLASSVCRQLNIESGPFLALLPRPSGQIAPSRSLIQSDGSDFSALDHRKQFRQVFSIKLVVFIALLSGLAYLMIWQPSPPEWAGRDFFKSLSFDRTSSQLVTQDVQLQPTATGKSGSIAPYDSRDPLSSPSASPASALAVTLSSQSSSASDTAAVKSSSVDVALAPASAQWVFSASGESWLELRNTKDVVIWSGILKAGESQRIDSPLPVRVVIGHAQVVSASLRGQVFDLKPHTQIKVARFEVKE